MTDETAAKELKIKVADTDTKVISGKDGLIDVATVEGADTVVTACPLCLYNLKKNGGHDDLPVVYFTELLAEALGVK